VGVKISVVICAHTADRWSELATGVASVTDQSHPPHEVIVSVDHDSELLERARAAFPHACVVENEGEPGVSGARNTGIGQATGDVVAFLDDDARADRHWLEVIARAHSDPAVLGTGGLIEPSWAGTAPPWMPPELYWIVGCSYRGLPTTVAPLRNPIGANMSFLRDVFADAGGFSDELGRLGGVPGSCEETEFAIRALRMRPDTVVLHLPDARVLHTVPRTRTTWRYLVKRSWTEGRAKALVTRAVGAGAGLSEERSYVTRVLPAAFLSGLRDALRGDPHGLGRAAAIVSALGITLAGYVYGRAHASHAA
jgi:GT2 family glycosyltransferase